MSRQRTKRPVVDMAGMEMVLNPAVLAVIDWKRAFQILR
jgi:hypothetical protein